MAPGILSGGGIFRRFLGSAVSNAAGYGVGGAILPTLEPYTRKLANETWSRFKVMPLGAGTLAEAWLKGYMDQGAAITEAGYTGFDETSLDVLRRLHGSPPSLDSLLALRRRKVIDAGELAEGFRQSGILPEWRTKIAGLLTVVPSVTDMVRFAVREVYDSGQRAALDLDAEFPGAFAADAERLGMDRETAGNYWAAHWELPSYEQGQAMLFRGEISAGEFSGLLKALDYAPVWRPRLESIARAIPPISDMIRFAVREVYDPQARASLGLDADYPAAFSTEAALHGMDDARARQYWAAHWKLPSAQQGYRMLWRGEITAGQLDGLLKALDYPAVWRDRLANIAHIVPGRIDLKRFLRHDILNRAQVKAGYQRLGYLPADAEHMTAIAEAELEASVVALPWANRARGRLYTVAHNEFMDGSIDEATASTLLAQVGAIPAERTTILSLWNAERGVNRTELTAAQVKKAYLKDLYTVDVALAELRERGMTIEDADTYLKS